MSKKIAFWLAILAVPLTFSEFGGYTLTKFRPDLFDQRQTVLSKLSQRDFDQFKQFAASIKLGWDNPPGRTRHDQTCGGIDVTYTYNQERVRAHAATSMADAVVLVAGDSYTHGDEVADDQTFPASLERILGVRVANLGVGGYGPDQALLKLEGLIDQFPNARVVVLAIMYEDPERMLNSYRPVLISATSIPFGLKPYIQNGEFREIIGGDPFRDIDTMRAAAEEAFDRDFWRRPRPNFPYTISAVEAALSPSNWFPAINRILVGHGRPFYNFLYSLPSIRSGLNAIYDRFARFARGHKLQAVVAFIPRTAEDRRSGEFAISAATNSQKEAITFVNVGDDFDWSHFTDHTCHPGAQGYQMIAADLAHTLRPLLSLAAVNQP
jgi:hypothetical protein